MINKTCTLILKRLNEEKAQMSAISIELFFKTCTLKDIRKNNAKARERFIAAIKTLLKENYIIVRGNEGCTDFMAFGFYSITQDGVDYLETIKASYTKERKLIIISAFCGGLFGGLFAFLASVAYRVLFGN